MKKFLLVLMCCMMISSVCLAKTSTPWSLGLVSVDNIVIGVNLDSPAYEAGIRPGNKINYIRDYKNRDVTEIGNGEYTISFEKNNKVEMKTIKSEKLKKAPEVSTFIVQGQEDDIYNKIVKLSRLDSELSPLLTIESSDKEMKTINIHSQVSGKTIENPVDYMLCGHPFSIGDILVDGTILVTQIESTDYCVVKFNLSYAMSWYHLFGKSKDTFQTTGLLERKVIERMNNEIVFDI